VQAAGQRVWQVTSQYLPQVGANYDADRRKTSATAQTGAEISGASRTFNFYQTGMSFSQVLFDFGKRLAEIRAAQAEERSAEADYTTRVEDVKLGVKTAYFNLLAAHRLLVVADETVRQTRKQLEQATGRFDVGLAPRFDVTRAEVQVANSELNQVTARNAVAVARETLRNAMGLTRPLDFDVVDTLDAPQVAIGEQEALDIAYSHRSELQSLEAQQESTEEQIESLQRDYLPSVTGGGTYYWSGIDYPLQDNWNIGASVTVSLFNGGLTTASIGEAKANLAELGFIEEQSRQDIALAVRQALLDVQQAQQSIGVARKGVQSGRESLALAEGRYNTGAGNIIELTDAQASFTTAEANLVQALYDYQISIANLERAMGRSVSPTGDS
jgi:outer membrane protein TolC